MVRIYQNGCVYYVEILLLLRYELAPMSDSEMIHTSRLLPHRFECAKRERKRERKNQLQSIDWFEDIANDLVFIESNP